jgi:hypothetical protein
MTHLKCVYILVICLWSLGSVAMTEKLLFMPPLSKDTCEEDYLALFSDGQIDMTIALGYFDAEAINPTTKKPYTVTIDPVIRDLLAQKIIQPCTKKDDKFCGFKLAENDFIYERMSLNPIGFPIKLRLQIINGSLDVLDTKNRNNLRQKNHSKEAHKKFEESLKTNEIVYYVGHSRDGAGPDFDPPILKANGKVDYDWYHKNKSDRRAMNNAIAANPEKSRLIILNSCSSVRWFKTGLIASSNKIGMLGTDKEFFVNANWATKAITKIFEHILSFECIEDFKIMDYVNKASLSLTQKWWVSPEYKDLTDDSIEQKTIEQLGKNLNSTDFWTREQSYWELKQYSLHLIPRDIQNLMKQYE